MFWYNILSVQNSELPNAQYSRCSSLNMFTHLSQYSHLHYLHLLDARILDPIQHNWSDNHFINVTLVALSYHSRHCIHCQSPISLDYRSRQ